MVAISAHATAAPAFAAACFGRQARVPIHREKAPPGYAGGCVAAHPGKDPFTIPLQTSRIVCCQSVGADCVGSLHGLRFALESRSLKREETLCGLLSNFWSDDPQSNRLGPLLTIGHVDSDALGLC
jgi:hypothetical protein